MVYLYKCTEFCMWTLCSTNNHSCILKRVGHSFAFRIASCFHIATQCTMRSEGTRTVLAVSSFSRPWIGIFAFIYRKIQHGGHWERNRPQGPKNVHNFLMTCGHGTEMLLIQKKLCLTWLFSDIFRYVSPKKYPAILFAVNLWLKPVSASGTGTVPRKNLTLSARGPSV